jgi:DNA-binding transcriptional ArsR family regulator
MSHTKRTKAPGLTVKQLVQIAKAVGHPVRLRILAMLEGRTLCVCQMTAILELASSTVSGHLNELRRSGLLVEDKQGKLVYYRRDTSSPFAPAIAEALALVRGDDAVALDRAVIDRVRAVPIEVLTGAGLQLDTLGIRRRRARPSRTPLP